MIGSLRCAAGVTLALAMTTLTAAPLQAVAAESEGQQHAQRLAYEAAMKCFVANSYVSGERAKAGDAAKAASYDANARKSFDLSYRAGEALGVGEAQVKRDLDFAQANELPKMVGNLDYLKGVAATCKALSLM
jgi:hypothetical protein